MEKKLNINDCIYIQGYKHDGSLHRTWMNGYVVEASEERTVVITNHTLVVEADGRRWVTREPAVCYFYPNRWFNALAMIRNTGIHYYVNIASPAIYDGEALKYIDYDLDVKVSPKGKTMVLDREEYKTHAMQMGYSYTLDRVLNHALDEVLSLVNAKKTPFDVEEVEEFYQKYLDAKEKKLF